MQLLMTGLMCRLDDNFKNNNWDIKFNRLNDDGEFRVDIRVCVDSRHYCCVTKRFLDYFCDSAYDFDVIIDDFAKDMVSSMKKQLSKTDKLNKESESQV